MSGKSAKPGMFGRLFGNRADAPQPDTATERQSAETPVEAPPQPDDVNIADADSQAGKTSWFSRLKSGLSRSSSALSTGVAEVFTKRKLDAQTLEDLEDLLIQADLGVEVAMNITGKLGDGRFDKGIEPEAVRRFLAAEIEAVLEPVAKPLMVDAAAAEAADLAQQTQEILASPSSAGVKSANSNSSQSDSSAK
ncbi:MAG: signal recognition particle receptor subunit alpha, partial [Hyphomicrobiales bacterium]